MSDRPVDPYTRHRFDVAIDGLEPMGFSEIRGLSVRVATGDGDADPHDAASPHLSLRRGVTDDRRLWTWLRDWIEGAIEPRDVSVYLLDASGTRGRGWRCLGATPVRWRGPELVAEGPAVATETLEVVHDGVEAIEGGDR